MKKLFKGGTVVTPFKEIEADVLIDGGEISAVSPSIEDTDAETIDVSGLIVAPGSIDLHCQGHEGRDLWEETPEAAHAVSEAIVKYGVTGVTPTTSGMERFITPIVEATETGVEGAQFLGIHSEGPFVSPERPGAIEPESIAPLTMNSLKAVLAAGNGHISIMTIAPELPGALEAIRYLSDNGVRASLGHSMATFDEANAAFDAGATRVTHLFNAMTSFADRADGGLAAAALLREDVDVEIVADGVHLHPAIMQLVGRMKGPGMASAVTDSVKVAGLPSGHYSSGGHGKEVYVDAPGDPPRLADGTIAGSGVSMDAVLRNLVNLAGFSRSDALIMASWAPARALGLAGRKGEIAPGHDADIVLYTPALEVERTYVAGELKFAKN